MQTRSKYQKLALKSIMIWTAATRQMELNIEGKAEAANLGKECLVLMSCNILIKTCQLTKSGELKKKKKLGVKAPGASYNKASWRRCWPSTEYQFLWYYSWDALLNPWIYSRVCASGSLHACSKLHNSLLARECWKRRFRLQIQSLLQFTTKPKEFSLQASNWTSWNFHFLLSSQRCCTRWRHHLLPHNDVALDDDNIIIIFFLTMIFYVKGCNHTLMGVTTSVTSAWFFMLINFVTSHEIESLESPDDEIRNLCTQQNSWHWIPEDSWRWNWKFMHLIKLLSDLWDIEFLKVVCCSMWLLVATGPTRPRWEKNARLHHEHHVVTALRNKWDWGARWVGRSSQVFLQASRSSNLSCHWSFNGEWLAA